jgi:hypothetical protein
LRGKKSSTSHTFPKWESTFIPFFRVSLTMGAESLDLGTGVLDLPFGAIEED